mmetsp:Transcript_45439/g.91173  ORF Transcript_45439/g.91173 Transcript_45439/m.91173 type:complete len:88 (+) Transcript_45439:124-387(+)
MFATEGFSVSTPASSFCSFLFLDLLRKGCRVSLFALRGSQAIFVLTGSIFLGPGLRPSTVDIALISPSHLQRPTKRTTTLLEVSTCS